MEATLRRKTRRKRTRDVCVLGLPLNEEDLGGADVVVLALVADKRLSEQQ